VTPIRINSFNLRHSHFMKDLIVENQLVSLLFTNKIEFTDKIE